MRITYILQNQKGYFLAKSGEWLDGREPSRLFKTAHQDEAANQLFEVNSKDICLRISTITCETTPKGLPIISNDLLPLPAEASTEDEQYVETEKDSTINTAERPQERKSLSL